jgi:PncC family amidohydrolase
MEGFENKTGGSKDETLMKPTLQVEKSKTMHPNDAIPANNDSPEHILDRRLKEKGWTLSLAESCTGGKLAGMFTAIPGCSQYFNGGVVSYSNEAKVKILGVNFDAIKEFGAVSQTVVEQMALGARAIFNSDCAIATSGIAGPGGGTPEKPVGTVWIAVSCKERLVARKFLFSNNRMHTILKACNEGISMLLAIIG